MKIVTWNVNGLRSVVRRDFEHWLRQLDADVICLQEVKIEEDLLTTNWFGGYKSFWNTSERPGYSGVATLVRESLAPSIFYKGIGHPDSDVEGRVLSLEVLGIQIVNVYAPHSHRTLIRLDAKLAFLAALSSFLARNATKGPSIVLGDLNIAHTEIDLANPKANARNAGFLPEEREWLSGMLASGFVDAFRKFEPGSGHYTWWSLRSGVRDRNVGWRLDYILVTESLESRLLNCRHMAERTGSDHCPVSVELS
ncbi:exodeoxyribonuclease III [Mesorhizobium sp. CN2-181]|uniref:exodeoxyribonuclease III n=1 Tax=Mesorhizobium yinganensis TaxID=3157707 RepID=UPI0032B847A9